MRESDLLNLIYASTRDMAARYPHVLLGPGDDAAAVRVDGSTLLLTVDQLVERRHFTPETAVELIARKAVARSVSDIAAMGGRPAWGLATGMLPPGYAHAGALTEALHRWGRHWGVPLVGGDLAAGPEGSPLVLTVTVGGAPHPRRGIVTRAGARPGDGVYVTGRLGGSFASGRHLTFEPRVAEAAWLCERLGDGLHAMIDVSDGLGRDAGRVAAASGVRIEMDGERVPCHEGVGLMQAVGEGEDYELLFAAAEGCGLEDRTPEGTPVTLVGRVVEGVGCVVRVDGREVDAAEAGWDHRV